MKRKKLILFIVAVAAFLSPFTQTIYTPLLPELQHSLSISPLLVNLTISIYTFVLAALQLVYGPLSDTYGRRKILLFGILVFIIGSIGCSFSYSIMSFIAFRVIQAVGMSGVTVVAVTVIGDVFEGQERGRALGMYQMAMASGPVFGPVIGGYIGGLTNYHIVFYILVFVGVAVFILIIQHLKETRPVDVPNKRIGLKEFRLISTHKIARSILPLAFIQYYSLYTFLVFLPKILTEHYHLSTSLKGLVFAPMSIMIILGSLIGGRVQYKWNPNWLLVVTTLINSLTVALFIFLSIQSLYFLIVSIIMFGLFLGLSLPVQMRILTDTFINVRGTAVGLYNLVRYMGMGIGPIIGALLYSFGHVAMTFGVASCLFFFSVINAFILFKLRHSKKLNKYEKEIRNTYK